MAPPIAKISYSYINIYSFSQKVQIFYGIVDIFVHTL